MKNLIVQFNFLCDDARQIELGSDEQIDQSAFIFFLHDVLFKILISRKCVCSDIQLQLLAIYSCAFAADKDADVMEFSDDLYLVAMREKFSTYIVRRFVKQEMSWNPNEPPSLSALPALIHGGGEGFCRPLQSNMKGPMMIPGGHDHRQTSADLNSSCTSAEINEMLLNCIGMCFHMYIYVMYFLEI